MNLSPKQIAILTIAQAVINGLLELNKPVSQANTTRGTREKSTRMEGRGTSSPVSTGDGVLEDQQ